MCFAALYIAKPRTSALLPIRSVRLSIILDLPSHFLPNLHLARLLTHFRYLFCSPNSILFLLPTINLGSMAYDHPKAIPRSSHEYSGVAKDDKRPDLDFDRATKKQRFEYVHVLATTLSWLCLVVAYITIAPRLPLAWYLGFNGQIVVIGLLLSIMNFCSSTVLSYTFLLLEARFGPSSLQNYEALLTSRITSPGTRLIWRSALGLLILLPLGLSVAYKRFLGGTSSAYITMEPTGEVSAQIGP